MFDKLWELLAQFLDAFAFMVIIAEYEEAVVLRFGKYNRTLGPGLHVIWPLFVEAVLHDRISPRTYNLDAQSLLTADGKPVVVSAIVTARIQNIRRALLDVESVDDALRDAAVAEIATAVTRSELRQLVEPAFCERLTDAVHKRAVKWGIEVMRCQLSDVAPVRSVRLFHDYSRQKKEF
jgi:regulator of protease activity HflC (stomatin/prohibitin superfamily)